MLSHFIMKRRSIMGQIGLIVSLFALFGQSQTSIILKSLQNERRYKKKGRLGFYLIGGGGLQLLQTSVNILCVCDQFGDNLRFRNLLSWKKMQHLNFSKNSIVHLETGVKQMGLFFLF